MDLTKKDATQRPFVYTHDWRVGDLVMWDDRCTMHRARDYDRSYTRDLRRTAVMDEAPPQPKPWNIVVMGMGEPLLNYDNTVAALRILMDPEGFAVAAKKLTVSTVGSCPRSRS